MSKNDVDDDLVLESQDEELVSISVDTAEELAITTNMYSQIRKRLALRGVPVDQIAFIHDAKTPEARAKLFAAVNKGTIRVLLGSTEKMGTGMNVQERCIAMHTITPPWRPGDIEQQVGRVLRQGNLFPQVFQFVHITEGSFDGYVWQLLENKAGFIDQLARGDVNAREIEDVSDTVLTFSEIKALASGNPLIMQKVVLEADYQRLSAVRSSWQSSKNRLFSDVRYSEQKRARTEEDIAALKEAARMRDANTPDTPSTGASTRKFSIDLLKSINDNRLVTEHEREPAGKQIITLAKFAAAKVTGANRTQSFIVIGRYRGFDLCVTASMLDDRGSAIPYLYFKINGETAQITADTEIGVTRSMDMRLKGIDALIANKEAMLPLIDADIQAAMEEINRPWEHAQRFNELEVKIRELDAVLNKDKKTDSQETPSTPLTSDQRKKVIENHNNTGEELEKALLAIQAMLGNPAIVARFASEADILSPVGLEELSKEIEVKQALFDLGTELVQFDLFGGSVSVEQLSTKNTPRTKTSTRKNRRR
ncbi:MAG: helicase C-terminal domain-containing protein [Anaerolineales bacterium]